MRPCLSMVLLLACSRTADVETDGPEPITLGPCVAPADSMPDTFVMTGSVDLAAEAAGGPTHVVRVAYDASRGILFGGGYGGIYAVDVSGEAPALAGDFLDMHELFHVALAGTDALVASNRDRGWVVLDVRDPAGIRRVASTRVQGAGPVAVDGDTLYIAVEGRLEVHDLSDRAAPRRLGAVDGLEVPSGIVVQGERAYIADTALGVVVVDVSEAAAPSVVATIATTGAPQAIVAEGTSLYVAEGTAGVGVYDLAGTRLATIPTGGPAAGVDVHDGVLAIADHGGITLVDVADPASPAVIGVEDTDEWAMAPTLTSDGVLLAEWNEIDRFELDRAVRAPRADPVPSTLYCPGPESRLSLVNRGGSDLSLTGGAIDDPRFSFTVDRTVVAPGESARIDVLFADGGAPSDAHLCLATDDPDRPLLDIAVASVSDTTGVALCAPAPDFSLPELATGAMRSLVDDRGIPLLILFFSTW